MEAKPFAFLMGAVTLLVVAGMAYAYTTCGDQCLVCDGTVADCQAAVDAASDGWVVEIADGIHTWASQLVIDKGIHLKGQTSRYTVMLRNSCPNPGWDLGGGMIRVTEDATHSAEVSDLTFEQGPDALLSIHISMMGGTGGRPTLIHDCDFYTDSDMFGAIKVVTNGGVIYGNKFTALYFNNSAIAFKVSAPSWDTPSTMGEDDVGGDANTYVESNTFIDYELQCMDFDDNSRAVVRYNSFFDCGIASHGLCTSPEGLRHFEVYNNAFHFDSEPAIPANLNYYLYIRGGTGIIADNYFDDIRSQYWGNKSEILLTVFSIRRACGWTDCCVSYPCIRQVGQSHDGVGYITDPVYIWGNTGTSAIGLAQYPDQCGNGQVIADYIQEGRDYNLYAKPGYSKYPYPHPLTGWEVAGANTRADGKTGATLYQNSPNPFKGTTYIRYTLAGPSRVRLAVYSTLGKEVALLDDAVHPAGPREVMWDGRNALGRRVSPGIYIYRLEADGITQSRKLLLQD